MTVEAISKQLTALLTCWKLKNLKNSKKFLKNVRRFISDFITVEAIDKQLIAWVTCYSSNSRIKKKMKNIFLQFSKSIRRFLGNLILLKQLASN